MVLETGPKQTEALGLYTKVGFVPCAAWGEHVDAPASRCFEKEL